MNLENDNNSKKGHVKSIVGANWGDEGKGKITDLMAAKADIVVRFQGGSNAGHTILNKYGKFALHQLPSGIFYENVVNILGNGCALNIDYLQTEIRQIVDKAPSLAINLLISDRLQLVLPHHILLDKLEEQRRQGRQFGSTKSGIAPFYSEKYAKEGIQLNEIFNRQHLKERLQHLYEKVNLVLKYIYNAEEINYMQVYDKLCKEAEFIQKYIHDTADYLQNAWNNGSNILLEGQLGALRDPDFGIYPYTTSSHTIAGFASAGCGLPPYAISSVVAVTKAYSSCVGGGAFVSEIFGDEADELRKRGGDAGEYGATTGRPRRMGYFDIVATRYGAKIQGATELALTALDVLSYMDELPVCIAYEIEGKQTDIFPTYQKLTTAKPVIKKLAGFKEDIRNIRNFDDLPKNAQNYVKFIEEYIGVKITMLSNGPKRDDMVQI